MGKKKDKKRKKKLQKAKDAVGDAAYANHMRLKGRTVLIEGCTCSRYEFSSTCPKHGLW